MQNSNLLWTISWSTFIHIYWFVDESDINSGGTFQDDVSAWRWRLCPSLLPKMKLWRIQIVCTLKNWLLGIRVEKKSPLNFKIERKIYTDMFIIDILFFYSGLSWHNYFKKMTCICTVPSGFSPNLGFPLIWVFPWSGFSPELGFPLFWVSSVLGFPCPGFPLFWVLPYSGFFPVLGFPLFWVFPYSGFSPILGFPLFWVFPYFWFFPYSGFFPILGFPLFWVFPCSGFFPPLGFSPVFGFFLFCVFL